MANGFDAGFVDKEEIRLQLYDHIAETAFVNTDAYPLTDFRHVSDLLDTKYKAKIVWLIREAAVSLIMTAFIYQRLSEAGPANFDSKSR